jgi:hypothetical protein
MQHIGNIGLVPDTNMAVNSIPPMKTGGEKRNNRFQGAQKEPYSMGMTSCSFLPLLIRRLTAELSSSPAFEYMQPLLTPTLLCLSHAR